MKTLLDAIVEKRPEHCYGFEPVFPGTDNEVELIIDGKESGITGKAHPIEFFEKIGILDNVLNGISEEIDLFLEFGREEMMFRRSVVDAVNAGQNDFKMTRLDRNYNFIIRTKEYPKGTPIHRLTFLVKQKYHAFSILDRATIDKLILGVK